MVMRLCFPAAERRGGTKPPSGGDERRHVPAVRLDPLADADQPVPETVGLREAPRPIVTHFESQLVGPVRDGHVRPAPAGVLEGVGQPLLHDAVRREVDGAR